MYFNSDAAWRLISMRELSLTMGTGVSLVQWLPKLTSTLQIVAASLTCAVAASLISLGGEGASAQSARTIRIIVPLPPGGAGDIVARLLAEQVGHAEGPTVV